MLHAARHDILTFENISGVRALGLRRHWNDLRGGTTKRKRQESEGGAAHTDAALFCCICHAEIEDEDDTKRLTPAQPEDPQQSHCNRFHAFHKQCICEWARAQRNGNTCPLCLMNYDPVPLLCDVNGRNGSIVFILDAWRRRGSNDEETHLNFSRRIYEFERNGGDVNEVITSVGYLSTIRYHILGWQEPENLEVLRALLDSGAHISIEFHRSQENFRQSSNYHYNIFHSLIWQYIRGSLVELQIMAMVLCAIVKCESRTRDVRTAINQVINGNTSLDLFYYLLEDYAATDPQTEVIRADIRDMLLSAGAYTAEVATENPSEERVRDLFAVYSQPEAVRRRFS